METTGDPVIDCCVAAGKDDWYLFPLNELMGDGIISVDEFVKFCNHEKQVDPWLTTA